MDRQINLMSERMRFQSAARRIAMWWGIALAGIVAAVTPAVVVEWRAAVATHEEREALEARYEPIRQLSKEIHSLRSEARMLVSDKKVVLDLARRRHPATLVALASQAVAAAEGEVFLHRLTIALHVPGVDAAEVPNRMAIEASATPTFDPNHLLKCLQQPPIAEAKLLSTHDVEEAEQQRKAHSMECIF